MSAKRSIYVIVFAINLAFCVKDSTENRGDKSRIFFPETEQIATPEIPLDLIRRLNALSNVDEFFSNMVEVEKPELIDRMEVETITGGLLKGGKTGKCMPELTTISLKPNHTSTTFYYPRCARVKRCGGCCLHDLFSCRPVDTEIVLIAVAIAEYRGGQKFRLKERKIIEVEQHRKCECGCKVQVQDCTKYQRYNLEKCRCECPNDNNARKCYKKIWNPDICNCMCRDELTCGTGFEFDFFTCSCVSSRGRKKSGFLYRIYA